MGQLGYTYFDQHSKNIARFRPEIVEANLLESVCNPLKSLYLEII